MNSSNIKMNKLKSKKLKTNWPDQLIKAIEENSFDGYFGSNTEREMSSVYKYLSKLEELGVKNIEVPNGWTITFDCPTM